MNPDQIRERYQQQLDRIQNNRVYSDHAKQVLAAKAWAQASQQLEQQRQSELAQLAGRREQLSRKMFGSTSTADPSTVLARRDAADRAAAIEDPRTAAQSLKRAERDGDHTLAQAIAAHANECGWTDVVDQYAASTPGFAEAAQEWNSLPGTGDDFWETRHGLNFLLVKPRLIGDLDDSQALTLAEEDMEAA